NVVGKDKKQQMTEAEWLASRDGVALANDWGERFTERKARLLMLACCRRRQHVLIHAMLHDALAALAGYYADPTSTDQSLDGESFRSLYTQIDEYTGGRVEGSEFWMACAVKIAIKPLALARADEQTLNWLIYSCLSDAASENTGRKITSEAPE